MFYEIIDMEEIQNALKEDFINKVNAEFDLAFQEEK